MLGADARRQRSGRSLSGAQGGFSSRVGPGGAGWSISHGRGRQRDAEDRTTGGTVLRVHLTVVGVHDLVHDCQPEAEAALLRREVRLEQVLLHLGWQSGPAVTDLDLDSAHMPRRAKDDATLIAGRGC